MSFLINKILSLNPAKLGLGFKNFSTSSIALKAMSTVRKVTEGENRKIKWYPYPIHDSRRNYFPRPRENKRILGHGFETRMSTSGGRRVLMRRILKGRHSLTHC